MNQYFKSNSTQTPKLEVKMNSSFMISSSSTSRSAVTASPEARMPADHYPTAEELFHALYHKNDHVQLVNEPALSAQCNDKRKEKPTENHFQQMALLRRQKSGDPSGGEEETHRNTRKEPCTKKNMVDFPFKLYKMLLDSETNGTEDIFSWLPDGQSFRIHDREKFVSIVLPRYYYRINIKSFLRQLNIYGFKRDNKKKSPTYGAYRHESFVRTHQPPRSWSRMQRKAKGSTDCSAASTVVPTRDSLPDSDNKTQAVRPRPIDASSEDPLLVFTGKRRSNTVDTTTSTPRDRRKTTKALPTNISHIDQKVTVNKGRKCSRPHDHTTAGGGQENKKVMAPPFSFQKSQHHHQPIVVSSSSNLAIVPTVPGGCTESIPTLLSARTEDYHPIAIAINKNETPATTTICTVQHNQSGKSCVTTNHQGQQATANPYYPHQANSSNFNRYITMGRTTTIPHHQNYRSDTTLRLYYLRYQKQVSSQQKQHYQRSHQHQHQHNDLPSSSSYDCFLPDERTNSTPRLHSHHQNYKEQGGGGATTRKKNDNTTCQEVDSSSEVLSTAEVERFKNAIIMLLPEKSARLLEEKGPDDILDNSNQSRIGKILETLEPVSFFDY